MGRSANSSARPGPGSGGAAALVLRLCNATDGVLDEFGWENVAARLPGGAAGWLDKVAWMERLQAGGVAYFSNNYVAGNVSASLPRAAVEWALASYLMGKEGLASLLVTAWDGAHVGRWNERPELLAAVGAPLAAMRRVPCAPPAPRPAAGAAGCTAYSRELSRSVVWANPAPPGSGQGDANGTVTVRLDPGYRYTSVDGGAVDAARPLALRAQGGRVLLRAPAPPAAV